MERTFMIGFGLELGSIYALCIWPETENVAVPLSFIGAGMMVFAFLCRK